MQYSNNHLVEVICGFQFPEESTPWVSTFFGQYFDLIKSYGFIEREERKGVQMAFGLKVSELGSPQVTTPQIEDQIVFRNSSRGFAIILSKQKISFHSVKEYPGWDIFLREMIFPFSELYRSLGLGNGKLICHVVYLNKFIQPLDVDLASLFNIVSPMDKSLGEEKGTFIQRVLTNEDAILITKVNSQINEQSKLREINFECGAICTNLEIQLNASWDVQASCAHEPIRPFFESIIKEQLRQTLYDSNRV